MQTAVSYSRYSTDMQHETSIEAQQDAIRRWADAHGVTVLRAYADRGISGTTDERPQFQAMIADCRREPVSFVLVHKYDRFSRNRYDAAIYGRMIQQTGARLVAVAQDFGTSPEAVIMESLMQAWAEYYSKNLSAETRKGLRVQASRGIWCTGTPPFGYRVSEDRATLAVDEEEAWWVRRWYEGYLRGERYEAMAHEAQAAGVTGRRGSPITGTGIKKLLRNETYTGVMETSVAGEVFRHEDHHPAIVDADTYREAMRRMESRAASRRAEGERTYLLTGLLRCGICGGRMRGHTQIHAGVAYPSYFCPCRHEAGKALRSIRTEELDAAVRSYLQALLTPDVREEAARSLATYAQERIAEASRRAPDAKRRIQKLEKKRETILANLAASVLPASVVQRLGEQVAEIETEIEALRAVSQAPPDPQPVSIAAFFADAAAISPETPIEDAQQIVRRFVREVIVTNDEIRIESTFADWIQAKAGQQIYTESSRRGLQRPFDISLPRPSPRSIVLLFPCLPQILGSLHKARENGAK